MKLSLNGLMATLITTSFVFSSSLSYGALGSREEIGSMDDQAGIYQGPYSILDENGGEWVVDGWEVIEEYDLEQAELANAELVESLGLTEEEYWSAQFEDENVSDSDLSPYAISDATAKTKKKKARKKPRYTNRGILGPKGAWPVGAGKCTTLKGEASYYGKGEKLNKHTSTGKVFNPHMMGAAHRTLPIGSKVTVVNLRNKKSQTVVINDRGPAIETGRLIDVTYGVAKKLDFVRAGLVQVHVRVCRG